MIQNTNINQNNININQNNICKICEKINKNETIDYMFASIDSFPQGLKFYLYSFFCLFFILKKGDCITITRNYFVCYLLLLFKKK